MVAAAGASPALRSWDLEIVTGSGTGLTPFDVNLPLALVNLLLGSSPEGPSERFSFCIPPATYNCCLEITARGLEEQS
jgi:hypothetical protein